MPLKTAAAALLLACPALPAGAADLPLPAGTALLGFSDSVSASWLLKKTPGDCALLPSPKAEPWLLCGKHFLMGAAQGRMFSAGPALADPVWLEGGQVLAAAGPELLSLPVGEALKAKAGPAPELLKPRRLSGLALENLRLYPAGADSLYLTGSDPKAGRNRLLLLARQGPGYAASEITSTAEKISAAAGDGRTTYAAVGRKVLRIGAPGRDGARKAKVIFEHVSEELKGLHFSPELGLFYSTRRGTGFIGQNYDLEFLYSPGAQVSVKGGAMLVLLADGKGVLRLDGLQALRDRDKAARGAKR